MRVIRKDWAKNIDSVVKFLLEPGIELCTIIQVYDFYDKRNKLEMLKVVAKKQQQRNYRISYFKKWQS